MPRRPQANNQKIAISASAVEHSLLDHTHLDQHQQLQQIEQQIQQQQQVQQQQQQEQFQQQHQLQQLQQGHSQQANDVDEGDEDEEDEEDEDEDDEDEEGEDTGAASTSSTPASTVPKAPLRSNGVVGRNVNLTNSQRKAISQMRIDNPEMTLSSLGQWAQKEFNLFRKPAMGTLSRIVHKNDVYSNMSAMELQVQRKRTVLCPELEDALLEWIRECQEREIHIAYRMITKKGYELGVHIKSMPGRENFTLPSFSNGWVSGFTKRNGLLGANLNPAASVLPMPEDELNIRPFSTNQQLLERVLQPRYRQRAAAHSQQNNPSVPLGSDSNIKIDHDDQQDHGIDMDMDTALSDINTDLHHQVIHAVASSSSYSATQSAVPDMPQVPAAQDTPVKKPRGRKPRGGGATTSSRRGKAAKTTDTADAAEASHMMDVEEASDELFQPLNLQQQQQHQMHPAAPGSSNLRARAGDRVPSTETALLANSLAHPQTHSAQALHQLQQQQQLQTILQQPSVSLAGGSSNSDLVTAVAADAVVSATSTSRNPTTAEVISAIRIVIENLDATIPGEAQLLKPLFNMERRLQDQIIAEDRQANLMAWNKHHL
ncbi:hypothetical protein BGW39_006238 [Mortierella sp. 14UC]|nr:hypothetical protein BGW39_006238 [Mortierella sp. 14UC]